MARPDSGPLTSARVQMLVAALGAAPPRPPQPLRASVLEKLRMPDGTPLSGDLATWLAFDATWLPLLEGKAKPRWALAEATELRPLLGRLGLARDVPLVALEPAASQDHYLALDPARGNPVLAWDQADLCIGRESFADYLEASFPVPSPPPQPLTARKVGRLKALQPSAVERLSPAELEAIAAGLGEKVNGKLLGDVGYVAAVVRALTRAGRHPEALFVARQHASARRGGLSLEAFVASVELAATWKDPDACRWALAEYRRRAHRDANSLYFVGQIHPLALECASVLGEQDAVAEVVEGALLFIGAVPDSVPVAHPALSRLWSRPNLRPFADDVARLATKQGKSKKTR